MNLLLQQHVHTAVTPSPRVLEIAAMFGLGIDDTRSLELIPPTTLSLRPGQIIFITGPSGGGKSSLLRLIAEAVALHDEVTLLRFEGLPALQEKPLVDALAEAVGGEVPLAHVLRWLSLAGLNDAFVLLRKPSELSDGQRYRLRLAQVMAMVETPRKKAHPLCGWDPSTVVLADEFGAALDRLTAKVLARQLRRWVSQTGICFIAATTHDDLLEALQPDTLIEKPLGEGLHIAERND